MEAFEIFSSTQDSLGESPRWHPTENILYWVDIEAGVIHRQKPGKDLPESYPVGVKIGCLAFNRSGGLILATAAGFQYWDAASNSLKLISNPEAGKTSARFNDGLVDGRGRFWAGTMTETDATSSLYRLDPDHRVHTMLNGVTISNGIGWNLENTRMYFTDTLKRTIWEYDYCLSSGEISNQRTFLHWEGEGVPDGLAVDSGGNVWCVICGAGMIQVCNSLGKIIDTLHFPTRCITACTFGGDDLSDLYVTSSRLLLNPSERITDTLAGKVFILRTNAHGIPANLFG